MGEYERLTRDSCTVPLATPNGGRGLSRGSTPEADQVNSAEYPCTAVPATLFREHPCEPRDDPVGLSPPDTEISWMAQTLEPKESLEDRNEAYSGANEPLWIVDSGCSRHMTYRQDWFSSYRELDTPIEVGTASGAIIKGIAEGSASKLGKIYAINGPELSPPGLESQLLVLPHPALKPTANVRGHSPPPTIGHLKAFGCLAYAHIPKERRSKREPSALKPIFVGYMPTTRQYRLYDPVKKRIVIATEPKFLEHKKLEWDWAAPNDLEESEDESVPFDPMGRVGDPNESEAEDTIIVDIGDRPPVRPVIRGGQSPEIQRDQSPDPDLDLSDSEPDEPRGPVIRGGQAPDEDLEVQGPQGSQDLEMPTGRPLRSREPTAPIPQNENPSRPQRDLKGIGLKAIIKDQHGIKIPKSYEEAINDPENKAYWVEAIKAELTNLQALGTWEYAELPPGKRAVGCKWVFTVKFTPTGLVDIFKARLVAQGFGHNYLETFSPTLRGESLKILLALGALEDLEIKQLDVVSAYPRAKLHATVYMEPPPVLECPKNKVLMLKTPLYGLKQSGREWYIEACTGLKSLGFSPCYSDPSIFLSLDKDLIIGLYVDDMMILGQDLARVQGTVQSIAKLWKIKNLGDVDIILGLRIYRDRASRTLKINQEGYVQGMLERFKLQDLKLIALPADDRNNLIAGDPSEPRTDQSRYQSAIGALMWIARNTRPDSAYAVGQLSQHCNDPTTKHWNGIVGSTRWHYTRWIRGTC
ncbi:hypothetical protein B7494_g7220 [Chlorociboria aeruginascens]|nr:hypothetical protein B7494_g7220 [Chlorociboria aeruginascens]